VDVLIIALFVVEKILVLTTILALAGGTPVSAKETKPQCPGIAEAYKAGYDAGYQKGVKEGVLKGFRMALQEFKKIYKEKLDEYRQLEAGKFLLKKWYISYPKVIEVPTGDGVKLIIGGCRPLKPLDDLPSKVKIPFSETIPPNFVPKSEVTPGVSAVVEKQNLKVPVEVRAGYEKLLKNMGVPYTKKVGSDYVTAYFSSENSAKEFCGKYPDACK